VTTSVSICFDPDNLNTLIQKDKVIMEEYKKFQAMLTECNGVSTSNKKSAMSKWIIRFELSREAMLEKNISMGDIHFAIKHSYKDGVECIYTDTNADNLIMRVRLTKLLKHNK